MPSSIPTPVFHALMQLRDGNQITRSEERIIAVWALRFMVDVTISTEQHIRLQADRLMKLENRMDAIEGRLPSESWHSFKRRIKDDLASLTHRVDDNEAVIADHGTEMGLIEALARRTGEETRKLVEDEERVGDVPDGGTGPVPADPITRSKH